MCGVPLTLARGHRVSNEDGYTLYCPDRKCPAQEVMGHGHGRSVDSGAKAAYNVIQAKFGGKPVQTVEEPEDEQFKEVAIEEDPLTVV